MASTERDLALADDPERREWRAAIEKAKAEKPVRSDIRAGGPGARFWCALLDGRPVAHCRAFDAQEGWVQVYTVARSHMGQRSVRTVRQVRLFGSVEAVWIDEFERLKQQIPPVEVFALEEETAGELCFHMQNLSTGQQAELHVNLRIASEGVLEGRWEAAATALAAVFKRFLLL